MEKKYGRLARLPLSIFGRAAAAAGYGVPKLLFQAEFAGLPTATASSLDTLTTKLVDRGMAPSDRQPHLPGVPSSLLPGAPVTGGFGVLPWRQHVTARHAC